MLDEIYVVTVKYNDVETIMSEWADLHQAALHADVLREDGYENVSVKRFTEAK